MRVKIILNPYADRGRAGPLLGAIESASHGHGAVDIALTDDAGHAEALAREAARANYDVVAAAGGDGTIHEVINGLLVDGRPRAALGLVPLGTGNDFAFSLGLDDDIAPAVQRLFTGERRPVDVGELSDEHGRHRFFANGVGIGLDAIVAIQSTQIKRLQGFPLYLAAALQTILFHYDAPVFRLRFDSERLAQTVLLLAAGVGRRAGGGFLLTPDALFDDGELDTCTVQPMSRLRMVYLLVRSLKGRHVSSSKVKMRRNAVVEVRSERPLPIHADGEIIARPEDGVYAVTLKCRPAGLDIVF